MRPMPGLSQFWLRLGLIVGELLFVAALVYAGSQRQLILVFVLIFGVITVLTFLRWPSLGLIIAVLAGLIIPYAGPSGLNVTMMLIALLLGLWLWDMMIRRGQVQLQPSRTIWPLLSLLLASVISFSIGQLPWFTFAIHAPLGAQLGGLSIIVLSAGTYLLAANQVRDLRWLRWITWVFLAVGLLSVLIRSVLPEFGLPTRDLFQRVGTVFYICVVGMAASQAIYNQDLHRGWRVVLAASVLVTLYVLFILKFDDKSGWLSSFVCLAAIIGARSWRVAFALTLVGVLAVLLLWTGIVGRDEYSVTTRVDAWTIIAQIVKVSPILGLGFANYYWYTPLFPIRGYAVSFNSHNNYVDIIAQTGFVGLVCFLWLLWEIGRLGWRLRKEVPAGFAEAYVYGALGVLAGIGVAAMLGDWVLPFFYNIGLNGFRSSMLAWLFLGGLVSLEHMATSVDKTNESPQNDHHAS